MKALRIAGIVVAAVLVAGLVMNFGDLKRYIKIEMM